jgi:sterol desaturase/sphingolipid hydroxylase (fatty acid hydroxylase superfamily)
MCLKPDDVYARKQAAVEPEKLVTKSKVVPSTHSAKERKTNYDVLFFLVPALFWKLTPIYPVYIIGLSRMLASQMTLSLHYIFVDKDNYDNKLSQKQLKRERDDYMVAAVLHMWIQVVLQIIFPGMFFTDASLIKSCAVNTFWSHVLLVEPLYYFAHRWLHIPEQMKAMHGFHHLSIKTTPTTSLVQNFHEHFIYVATFGPAFLAPFFLGGCQHWVIIMAYLLLFDLINAYGHMNIRLNHWIWTSKYSPMYYLFYTPEFHLGHHAYFNANYGLFMPIWDLMLGTHREYKKKEENTMPANKQDFVFIGHNGGLGHLLTCPEFSLYNVYDSYRRTFLPIQVEFLLVHIFCQVARLFARSYSLSRYIVQNAHIGRIICILRTPIDFMSPKSYRAMNQEIVDLMKNEYKTKGTRYFGLGNLTKMKQLNDGGRVISEMIQQDEYLKDKNIRVWTGDSLTSASVYNQIADIPGLKEFFYIGANGKIGNVVCEMLLERFPQLKIRVLSSYEGMKHPRISYTKDMNEIVNYEVIVSGKILPGKKWEKAFKGVAKDAVKTRFILDYTVPCIPIKVKGQSQLKHIQIGLLEATSKTFLRGHFDICMSHDENHIYPCHAGCIINMVEKRESDETGDVDPVQVRRMWEKAVSYGFRNRTICYK